MGRNVSTEPLVCERCGAASVIQIELTLPDGTEVDFCSCHRCESRWWNQDGEALELDTVLEMARRPRS